MANNVNGPLYFERLGRSGIPIAFIHPNPMDQSCWIYQMAHFSSWYRCIGIDIPGYGRSPTGEVGMTVADMADACWEAIDEAVGSEPAILVGCSTGSRIAPWMFHRQPERTLALVLSGTGHSTLKDFIARDIHGYAEKGPEYRREYTYRDLSPEFGETEMAEYFANLFCERNEWVDVNTIIEQFLALGRLDPPGFHAAITAPTMILTGSKDGAHERAFALRERIPNCELYTLEGAGHACMMEKPWEFDREMRRFLAKHGLFTGTAPSLGVAAEAAVA